MQLPQLLKHYGLSAQQLESLLSENGIKTNLRFIRQIPDEWFSILSTETSIDPPNPEGGDVARPVQVAETLVEEAGKVTLNILDALLHDEPTSIVAGIEKKGKIQYDKGKEKAKQEFFWAYVKFIAEDKSHGYVKRIANLDDISPRALHIKDDNDYFLSIEGAALQKDQLIVCSSKTGSSGKKRARIEAVSFTGIVKSDNRATKIYDLSSRLCPQSFNVLRKNLSSEETGKLVSFTLSISGGLYYANGLTDNALEVKTNEFGLIGAYKRLIASETLSASDVDLLQIISLGIEEKKLEATKISLEYFNKDKDSLSDSANVGSYASFLSKWMQIRPDILSLQNMGSQGRHDYYMRSWLKGLLPANYWGTELIDACTEYLAKHSIHDALQVCHDLRGRITNDCSNEFNVIVSNYISGISSLSKADEYLKLCRIAKTVAESEQEKLLREIYKKLDGKAKLELWLNDSKQFFPYEEAVRLFSELGVEVQDKVVELLDSKDLLKVSEFISRDNNISTIHKFRLLIETEIIHRLDGMSIDIESDGNSIHELAWGSDDKWFSGIGAEEVEDLKQTLQNRLENSAPLLIGHNIIDFDYPILKEHGLEIEEAHLWDTLLVEMVLSPGLRTYALKTNHKAISDASLALKVFKNQVLRILCLNEEEWSLVQGVFQLSVRQALLSLRSSVSLGWVDTDLLKEELLTFIRPQPKKSTLLENLIDKLQLSEAETKVILASSDFWEELREVPNLRFYPSRDSGNRFLPLDEYRVLKSLVDNTFDQVIIKRFFDNCRNNNIKPLAVNLPPAVRTRLSGSVDLETVTVPQSIPDWAISQTACLDVYELARQEEDLLKAESSEIYVVEPDLISLTFKKLLKEIDLNYIINNPAVENLWIKFSGGQSFIELTKEQAISLGVSPPDGFTNFWIEKYIYGKYRIWGNYNWENHLAGFPAERIIDIKRKQSNFSKEQASYLVVNQRKLQKDVGITRFNPETNYRSRYWVVQKELIEGIIKTDGIQKPLVLLIQRPDEVEALQQYFNVLGYYIPDSKAALARRLELLHQSKRSHKILITTVSDASRVINTNYLGPLNIVWDSFNLYENYYLAKGSKLFKKSITTSADIAFSTQKENDESASSDTQQPDDIVFLQRDIFFLLKLQIPLINRLRTLLADDHHESRLWLLDARIEDFAALGEKWNARKVAFKVWDNKESYDSDAKVADTCILSPRPENNLPFSHNEAKKILASVFLPDNKYWYDYQVEYLDKILPAERNLLISLPTGGGKSLLFQAPALFRSSFTNRLTIVITPLKALMEDQVQALWKMGFYGSVDYINRDKSDEVMHIYRRLAGGELSLLFITPERFRSGGFIKAFSQRFDNDGGLEYAVYDEAHCISQWGHEFRPDYLYSGKAVQRFKDINERKFPVLLFSATVSEKIYRDFNLIFK